MISRSVCRSTVQKTFNCMYHKDIPYGRTACTCSQALPPTVFDHFQDAKTGGWSGRSWGEGGVGVGGQCPKRTLRHVCVKVGGVYFVYRIW